MAAIHPWLLVPVLLAAAAGTAAAGGDPVPPPDTFAADVQPFLKQHCYDCHGPQKQKAGIR